MIYYFSGTGNSEWVAHEVAAKTNDKAVNIAEFLKYGNKEILTSKDDVIGFVFPIYAWGVPKPVLSFIKQLQLSNATYRYAICTCGDEAGLALNRLHKTFPLTSGWSISMPNNYIIMADLDPVDIAKQKVNAAIHKITSISNSINKKEKVWDTKKGSLSILKSYVIYPLFSMSANHTNSFTAEQTCTSCGLCEKVCPLNNIKMSNGKPEWSNHCTQCLACIHHCPVKAIQFGKGTKQRGRYTFKSFSIVGSQIN